MKTPRDVQLDMHEQTARDLGKTEEQIRAARDECERTNTDIAFRELILPDLKERLKKLGF